MNCLIRIRQRYAGFAQSDKKLADFLLSQPDHARHLSSQQDVYKRQGLDYELAQQFADYLGVKLKITVRQNISQLFDDLDNNDADILAAGLVYNSERSKMCIRDRFLSVRIS